MASLPDPDVFCNAYLSARPKDRDFVGMFTHHDGVCKLDHPWYRDPCSHCHWNGCQVCGMPEIVCLDCGSMPECVSTCRYFNEMRFGGWSGLCVVCKAKGEFKPRSIPSDWIKFCEFAATEKEEKANEPSSSKEADPNPPPEPVAAGGAPASKETESTVIIIDDDEDAFPPSSPRTTMRRRTRRIYPAHWEVPESGNANEIQKVLMVDSEEIIHQRFAERVLGVVQKLDDAREASDKAPEEPPSAFVSCARKPPYFVITRLRQFQNFGLYKWHKNMEKEINERIRVRIENNDPSRHKFQNSPTTVTAFHGTSLASADLILKHGASSNVTNCGQYGRGFYVGCGRLGVPIKYAFDKYFGPTLVVGPYARGWFSRTETNSVFPEDNRDSGGCGNDWIGTMMNNNYMFYPEHVVELRRATKEEWEEQKEKFKAFSEGRPFEPAKKTNDEPQHSTAPASYSPTSPSYSPSSPSYSPTSPSYSPTSPKASSSKPPASSSASGSASSAQHLAPKSPKLAGASASSSKATMSPLSLLKSAGVGKAYYPVAAGKSAPTSPKSPPSSAAGGGNSPTSPKGSVKLQHKLSKAKGFNSSSSDEEDDHASDPNWSTRKRARKAGQKKKEK